MAGLVGSWGWSRSKRARDGVVNAANWADLIASVPFIRV